MISFRLSIILSNLVELVCHVMKMELCFKIFEVQESRVLKLHFHENSIYIYIPDVHE